MAGWMLEVLVGGEGNTTWNYSREPFKRNFDGFLHAENDFAD
jgi:hypothetical protein